MIRSQYLLPYLLPVIASCLVLVSCSKETPKAEGPKAFPVEVEQVQAVPVVDSSTYVARMDSRKTVVLRPKVDGHVVKIMVDPEQLVKPGQPLIEIDPFQVQASVASKEAGFESAQAQYYAEMRKLKALEAQRAGSQADVEFAEKEFTRYTNLLNRGAVSKERQEEKDRALKVKRADAESLEAQISAQLAAVKAAERQMNQSRSDVRVQEEELEYHVIKAPFAGTVGNIPVKIGDYVTPASEITSVSQRKPLEAYIQVPKDEAKKVHHGTSVELLDEESKVIGMSSVFYVSPTVDTSTQSVLVKSLYENQDNILRPEQNVSARVVWGRSRGIVVPTRCLAVVGGQPFVYVAQKDDRGNAIARQKPVKLGQLQSGNGVLVENGLAAGEILIVSGVQNLSDGAPILTKS